MVSTLRCTLVLFALSSLCAVGQSPSTSINVLARDHNGHPIRGLTATDFHLALNGQPVPITRIDEHTPATPTQPILPVSLPPGTFADVTRIPSSDTLNILVLDALNTPPEAQHALQAQLQRLAQDPPAAAHLAIFGLTTHLILLQDFTTGPNVLKDATSHQLIPRGQALLDTTHDLTRSTTAQHDIQLMQLAANLHLFETTAKSVDRQFRQQYTLDAMHSLAVYLDSLPGHKNVLWLAPSFPVTLTSTTPNAELTQTAILFNDAGVSLYPIDARTLFTSPSAAHPLKFPDTPTAERAAMQQLASTTGGAAILNPANLQDAIARAAQFGSAYYTLAFTIPPITPPLRISLTGPASATLTYPRGTPQPAAPDQTDNLRAALARGAPAPEALPFKVRVLPAATPPEPTIAPGNQQDPSYKIPGPWQRFEVDFATLAADLTLTPNTNGQHTGKFEALAYVFDLDGRILNTVGQTVTVTLTPAEYDRLRTSALSLHLEISVPLRQQSYLRLVLHDIPSGHTGVLEIPVSAVSHLRPVAPTPASPQTPAPSH